MKIKHRSLSQEYGNMPILEFFELHLYVNTFLEALFSKMLSSDVQLQCKL